MGTVRVAGIWGAQADVPRLKGVRQGSNAAAAAWAMQDPVRLASIYQTAVEEPTCN